MEEWREVVGFPNYHVSNKGRITGQNGKVKKPWFRDEHPTMQLCDGGRHQNLLVRRIVYEAFVGPIPAKMFVINADGDPMNNSIENLKLVEKNSYKKKQDFTHKASDGPDMPPLTDMDNEGTIKLWEAIVDRAVADAAKSLNEYQRKDAYRFLTKTITQYLDIYPEYAAESALQRISEYLMPKEKTKPEKEQAPAWKERCKECMYHLNISGDSSNKSKMTIACGYMYYTGKRRGMPGSECTRFEPYEQQAKGSEI